jgi:hypothetical protein
MNRRRACWCRCVHLRHRRELQRTSTNTPNVDETTSTKTSLIRTLSSPQTCKQNITKTQLNKKTEFTFSFSALRFRETTDHNYFFSRTIFRSNRRHMTETIPGAGNILSSLFWNKNFDKRSELMLWNEMHKNETSETPSQLGNNSCHSRQETEAKKAETNSIWICSEWVYYQAFNHGLCRRVWGCSFYWRCKLKCS